MAAFTLFSILYPSCIFQSVFRLKFTSFDAVRVWDFFTISFVAFNLHFHFTPKLCFTVFSSLQLIIQRESHLRATYAQCEDVPLMAPTIGAYMRQSPCDEKLKFLIFNKIFLLVPLHTLGKVQLCVSFFASLTVLLLNRRRMRKFSSFYFFTQHRKNVLCFMCFIFFCECSWLELTFLSRTNLKLVIQHRKNFTRQSRRKNQRNGKKDNFARACAVAVWKSIPQCRHR